MNVPAEFHKIFFFFDQDSLVTPLKQVTTPTVAAVEIHRVGGIEALHEFPQVGFWGHHKKVEMSLHQDIRMQLHPIKPEVGGKDFKPFVPVSIIPEDIPFLIPPARDVIPSSRIFYPKRSSHKVRIQN
jgi:hypothetical protein